MRGERAPCPFPCIQPAQMTRIPCSPSLGREGRIRAIRAVCIRGCASLSPEESEEMIQIDDVIVSLDVFREKFLCDLGACKGACCIEGDAGAPVETGEVEALEASLPAVWNDLSPEARTVIDRQGVVYVDEEGDLVTSIVNGKDCVFTCYDESGCCYCALEKAYREGRISFYKPISCHLYPIRIGDYGPYKAVNYHRWDVCRAAVELGRKKGVPVYRFLREPLIRKFGEDWYHELEEAAVELEKQGYLDD